MTQIRQQPMHKSKPRVEGVIAYDSFHVLHLAIRVGWTWKTFCDRVVATRIPRNKHATMPRCKICMERREP